MKDIKKKLVKQVKRSRPSLAQEIKDMPMKDFRALWFANIGLVLIALLVIIFV